MRGDNHTLAITTTRDEVTGEAIPLFAYPIQVCKATDPKDVALVMLAPSGARIEQPYYDPTEERVVPYEECGRGIEVGGQVWPIDHEAWAKIDDEVKAKTEVMTVLGTVPLTPAFWVKYAQRITGRYFIQSPTKGMPKAYQLTYEALCETRTPRGRFVAPARGIVTKRVPRSRQRLCLIFPDADEGCLAMVEMHFAASMRKPDEQVLAARQAQVAQAQVDTLRRVLDGLPDGFAALDTEEDAAVALRQRLVDDVLTGRRLPAPTPRAETAEADDLMARLEASLA